LASFSNLQFPSYLGQQQQEQLGQQQQELGQQQQTGSAVKTTTTEKKRITIKRKVVTTSQEPQQGQQTMQEPQHPKQTIERKKITIKRKTVTTTTTTTTAQSQEQPKNKQKCDDCFHTVTDYAPLETMFYQPRSDYIVPPPSCSRFFIENKHCFLRRHDNACIDPSTKKVIGFWNEQVGENCKLLPLEAAYEEVLPSPPVPSPPVVPTPSPKKQKHVTNPRFVSDAQRSRIACEPVALLREKLALQYGIIKQRN
jgi:hypothetical protein